MSNRQATKKLPEKIYRSVIDLDKVFFTGDPTKLDGLGKVDLPAVVSNKTDLSKNFEASIAKQLKKGVIPENVDVGNMVVLKKDKDKGILAKKGNGEWEPAFKWKLAPKVDGQPPSLQQVFSEEIKPEALKAFQASTAKQGIVSRVDNAKTDDFASPAEKDVMDTGGINEGGYDKYTQRRTILPKETEAKLSDPNSTLGWWLGARSRNTADTATDTRTADVYGESFNGLKRTANTLWRPAAPLTLLNMATGYEDAETNPEGKGWIRRPISDGIDAVHSGWKGMVGPSKTLTSELETAKRNTEKVAHSVKALKNISPTFTLDKDTLNRSFGAGGKNYNAPVLSTAFFKVRGNMTDKEFFSISPDAMLEKATHAYDDEVKNAKSKVAANGEKPKDADYPDLKTFVKEVGDGEKPTAMVLPSWLYQRDVKDEGGNTVKRTGVKAMVNGVEKNLIPVIVASNTKQEREIQNTERAKSNQPRPIEVSKQLKYAFIDPDEKDPNKKFLDFSDVKLID